MGLRFHAPMLHAANHDAHRVVRAPEIFGAEFPREPTIVLSKPINFLVSPDRAPTTVFLALLGLRILRKFLGSRIGSPVCVPHGLSPMADDQGPEGVCLCPAWAVGVSAVALTSPGRSGIHENHLPSTSARWWPQVRHSHLSSGPHFDRKPQSCSQVGTSGEASARG